MIAKTLIIQKGEPRVSGEMPPKEVNSNSPAHHSIDNFIYQQALDTFIKNSVAVGNTEGLEGFIYNLPSTWIEYVTKVPKDGIYNLPEGITYEVKQKHSDEYGIPVPDGRGGFKYIQEVAILTFAPKEKPNNI